MVMKDTLKDEKIEVAVHREDEELINLNPFALKTEEDIEDEIKPERKRQTAEKVEQLGQLEDRISSLVSEIKRYEEVRDRRKPTYLFQKEMRLWFKYF